MSFLCGIISIKFEVQCLMCVSVWPAYVCAPVCAPVEIRTGSDPLELEIQSCELGMKLGPSVRGMRATNS